MTSWMAHWFIGTCNVLIEYACKHLQFHSIDCTLTHFTLSLNLITFTCIFRYQTKITCYQLKIHIHIVIMIMFIIRHSPNIPNDITIIVVQTVWNIFPRISWIIALLNCVSYFFFARLFSVFRFLWIARTHQQQQPKKTNYRTHQPKRQKLYMYVDYIYIYIIYMYVCILIIYI